MKDTLVVRVGRRYTHPTYHKVMEDHKKYFVHSAKDYSVGQVVTIEESRPISKLKRWKVVGETKIQEPKTKK